MAFTANDLIETVRSSRKHFLKHLRGLKPEQWDWKPYPECKSIRETLAHLLVDDRSALDSLKTGKEPDYDSYFAALSEEIGAQPDTDRLFALLAESHRTLCDYLSNIYGSSDLDVPATFFGMPMKAGAAIASFTAEDYYHAGQVAYVRMASDPEWDYYAAVYAEA